MSNGSSIQWFVGADHAGLLLKDHLTKFLRERGDLVDDVGTYSADSVDYPDYAWQACRKLLTHKEATATLENVPTFLGLLICGSGIGMSISANKIPGIRAACVSEPFSAKATREHNDANVLCMGARVVGVGLAEMIVTEFRNASFAGQRHLGRVNKMCQIEAAPHHPPGQAQVAGPFGQSKE